MSFTYDSPQEEEEASVSYEAAAPGQYQATSDADKLAEDNQSGSIYVQPTQAVKESSDDEELYYIYYQEPQTSNGVEQDVTFEEPLYYQSDAFRRTVRGQPATTSLFPGESSQHFVIEVKGQQHGFSHQLDHAA